MRKAFLLALTFGFLLRATVPDAATERWWSHIQALANDSLQGRDTGSPGYKQAEKYVIEQFQKAGLSPAGTVDFKQPVPLHALQLDAANSPVQIIRAAGPLSIAWFRQLTIGVRPGLPAKISAPLYFVGDPASVDPSKVRNAVVVVLGTPRIRKPGSPAPAKLPDGAAASITIDSLAGPEPPIWPLPYARTMSLAETPAPTAERSLPAFRFNPDSAELLFAGSGHSFADLKSSFEAGRTIPNFPLDGNFQGALKLQEMNLTSDNILAVLPGSDPTLKNEYVVLSAHLDGYGIGEARHGDAIYNGAFDDAAYVALLIDLAQSLATSHTRLKRSLLFCIVTAEEKGLLGSKYFAAHPTVPKKQLVADLNLDQLRPIFPLKVLTTLALNDSTLGQTVQEVAQPMGITIQDDPEPERNLLRRSDHFSFMQIGVPAVNFVFGYAKGSGEEQIYRRWYAERYHSPADDLQQPWVPEAAARFNKFYAALVTAVANLPTRPQWNPQSKFAGQP